MSEYLIKEDTLGLLANTIRNKSGLTGKLNIGDMILAIEDLQLGVDTSDATASSAEIAEGYTAYVNGVKLTGEGEILASAGTSVENFLAQNPGYFDNADTTTGTPGNNATFDISERFRFEVNSAFKFGSSWQKYTTFEDYGVLIYKDHYGIYNDTGMTYLDMLNNQETIVYQKKDGIIGDKILNNSIPGFKIVTRDMWLDESDTPLYIAGYVKKNGQVYVRPNALKLTGMRDAAQQIADKNSNVINSNLMLTLIAFMDAYLAKYPQTTTTTYKLLNRNQPALYETEIE